MQPQTFPTTNPLPNLMHALFYGFHRSLLVVLVLVLGLAVGVGLVHSVYSHDVGTVNAAAPARVSSVAGGRVTDGLLTLYDFGAGSGDTVFDVSGVGTPLDLQIFDNDRVKWLPGSSGIEFICTGSGAGITEPATKIISSVVDSNALTLETWIIPSSMDQGSSSRRIVSVSQDNSSSHIDLQLNQKRDATKFKLRTSDSGVNSLDVDNVFSDTETMKHLVVTYDGVTKREYVDGVLQSATLNPLGDLSNWSSGYPLTIGNDASMDRGWLGRVFLVATYDRALSDTEVTQNFDAGSGATFPVPLLATASGPADGLITTAVSYDHIDLDWVPPSEPVPCIQYYKVYRNGELLDNTTPSSFTDTDVEPNTTYTYQVSVVNELGMESALTAPLEITSNLDPFPPAIDSAEATTNSLRILFNEEVDPASATDISNYSIDGGIAISGAAIADNDATVVLTTTAHTNGSSYTLTTSGVEDTEGNAMPLTELDYVYVSGLVGHWTFDEGSGTIANDSSGLGNHGTLINSPVWVDGHIDGGLRYDRTLQQSVLVNNAPILNFGDGSFSISLWVRYTDTEDTDLIRKGSTATADNWYKIEIVEGNRFGFNINTTEKSSTTVHPPVAHNDGQWHHVVGVRDVTQEILLLYVDGVLVGTHSDPSGSTDNEANLTIGSKDTMDDDFLSGDMDDVRLFNRSISAAEVLELFNTTSGGEGNTLPTADDQSVSLDEDAALGIALTASDPDLPPQTLTYTVVDQPGNGSLSGTAPDLTYTPNPDFNGADSFTFRVNDGIVNSNLATVDITVNPVNDPPVADHQEVSTSEDVALGIALTAADPDLPPQALTYSVLTQPVNGSLSGAAPDLTYTPDPSYNGVDSFTFRVNDGSADSNVATVDITVVESNDPPVADDQSVSTDEDAALGITLTAADPDLPPQTLDYTVLTQPGNGTLSGIAPDLTYTPDPNFNGADSFTFRVSDGIEDSNVATVDLTVNPVNDPPVADDQSVSTDEDAALGLTLTAADLDLPPQALTYSVVDQPGHGTLSGVAPDLTYTPDQDYSGADSFTFRANDGSEDSNVATVDVTVNLVNDPPVADDQSVTTDEDAALGLTLTAADPDLPPQTLAFGVVDQPAHGVLSGTAPDLTYTPDQDYSGADSFTFLVDDGIENSNIATVDITINPVNDLPVADDQSVATDEDVALGITLTGTDPDLPPQTLTYTVLTQPGNGSLSGVAPDLTYTPAPGYNGPDSFTFQISDGVGNSNVATVDLTVNPVNDPPVADDQSVTTDEDVALGIALTATDPDLPPQPLTYTVLTQPVNGSLSGTAPDLTYTPALDSNGADSFTFRVNDGLADSNVATVSITVNPLNDPPVAEDQAISVSADNPEDLTLSATDPDLPPQPLTYTVLTQPVNGSLSGVAPDLTYTPDQGFTGSDSFTFRVNDGLADSNVATINVTVSGAIMYSAVQNAIVLGDVSLENEDIFAYDGTDFSMFFDGSDVGLGEENGSFAIDALSVISPNEIIMSFTRDVFVPGIAEEVEDTSVVIFTATSLGEDTSGSFAMYFHGRSVGLTSNDEDITAVERLPDGRLLISTRGAYSVPGLSGDDEDLIVFTPTSLGDETAGTWDMYFDGSDVDLGDSAKENLSAVAVDSTTGDVYLSNGSSFHVTGLDGHREDVFVFHPTTLGVPTSGVYDPFLFFDGDSFGLGANNSLMGLDLP